MASISSSPPDSPIPLPAPTPPLVAEDAPDCATPVKAEASSAVSNETPPAVSNETPPAPAGEGESIQAFTAAGSPRLPACPAELDDHATDPTDDPRAPLLGGKGSGAASGAGDDGVPGAGLISARMLTRMRDDLPVLALGTTLTSGVMLALSFIFPAFGIAAVALGAASAVQIVACLAARYASGGTPSPTEPPVEPPVEVDNPVLAEPAEDARQTGTLETRAMLTGDIEDWAAHLPTLRDTTTAGERGFDLSQALTRFRSSIDGYDNAELRTGYTNSLRNSLVQAEHDQDFRTRILPRLAWVAGATGDEGITTIMAMSSDLMNHNLAVRTKPT